MRSRAVRSRTAGRRPMRGRSPRPRTMRGRSMPRGPTGCGSSPTTAGRSASRCRPGRARSVEGRRSDPADRPGMVKGRPGIARMIVADLRKPAAVDEDAADAPDRIAPAPERSDDAETDAEADPDPDRPDEEPRIGREVEGR